VPDQQPPFLVTDSLWRRPGVVKGGISGVSEPLTARTAAYAVTGEKGAAWLAYLAARFAQGGGGRAAGGADRSSAEIKVTARAGWRAMALSPNQCDAGDAPRR
jgi:hypothetical protein